MYSCSKCGSQYTKWQGRCSTCEAWGTIKSENDKADALAPAVFSLAELKIENTARQATGINELDRVLGGGLVGGSLILLGGDPGIGKSTLALQLIGGLKNCLYVSGEESATQVKIRAERLKTDLQSFKFIQENNLEKIIAGITAEKPRAVIIDSIQTVATADAPGGFGSVSQITASATKLLAVAKNYNITIILIGHVTKDGSVAGPKTLEHLVDAVLYIENDEKNFYRLVRAAKNRFGSTDEVGIFEMTSVGFKEIGNPTEIFISDNDSPNRIGNIVSALIEGTRPFLVEIEALVNRAGFGYPQRKVAGFDVNRLQMIVAVLTKIAKINLSTQDIYLNVAGGLKIKETGIDLAAALAIVSAFNNQPVNGRVAAFGEIGLSGDIRSLPKMDLRIKEAKRLGCKKIIAPFDQRTKKSDDVIYVKNITEAIKALN